MRIFKHLTKKAHIYICISAISLITACSSNPKGMISAEEACTAISLITACSSNPKGMISAEEACNNEHERNAPHCYETEFNSHDVGFQKTIITQKPEPEPIKFQEKKETPVEIVSTEDLYEPDIITTEIKEFVGSEEYYQEADPVITKVSIKQKTPGNKKASNIQISKKEKSNNIAKAENIKTQNNIKTSNPAVKQEILTKKETQNTQEVKKQEYAKKQQNPNKEKSEFFMEEVEFSELPNWDINEIAPSFDAFIKSCNSFKKGGFIQSKYIAIKPEYLNEVCKDSENIKKEISKYSEKDQKHLMAGFFIKWFSPYAVYVNGSDIGTITGYYEAHIKASRTKSDKYKYPIYAMPRNEEDRKYTREEINNGSLEGKAKVLFWAENIVDIFIAQIQGSCVVELEDDTQIRIGYAGNNGHKFTGTGEAMKKLGIRPKGGYAMDKVRDWLKENPEKAMQVMNENKRYIFFKENEDVSPIGTLGAPLTSMHSIAVDSTFIPLGIPLYLSTKDPDGKTLDRVVIAQDTGTAIKGGIRADFFYGFGEEAFSKAGRMKQNGKYYLFLPKDRKSFYVADKHINCLYN